MKFYLKNIAVFIAFTLIFSALISCSKTDSGNIAENTTTPKKSDYPPAPSAIMQNEIKMVDGSTVKLEDKKGKVILLNMWATWCGPCIGEMPHFVELQEKYKDKGFEVIGLDSEDEDKDLIEKFSAKQNLNYRLGWADSKMAYEMVKLSKLQGIPQSIIIDRDGNLNGVFRGGGADEIAKMKSTVERLMNE